MTAHVAPKIHFQKLSKIEIFRKSKDFGLILNWIINMYRWCYIWCWKQHIIIVAGFQQKCYFSAPNVDFSWLFILIHVKIENQTKKQHLLPEKNNFVENQQQWCYIALHIIHSIIHILCSILWLKLLIDSWGIHWWKWKINFITKFPRNLSKI